MKIIKELINKLKKHATLSIGDQKFLSIQLDITNSCNLSCIHCYHSNNSNIGSLSLSLEDWIDILDEYQVLLNTLSLKPSIIISGGEPLTCHFLFDLIKEIRHRWPLATLIILTNGTLLNTNSIKIFKEYDVSIQVSLEASNSSEHDRIRGKGTFEKSINNIKWAVEEGLIVYILAVLSSRTSNEIGPLFKLAKELGVIALNFTRLIPQGKAQELVRSTEDKVLTGLQLRDAYKNILNYSRNTGVATSTNKPLYVLIDSSLGENNLFGFQGLVVDYLGNLKVSSRSNYILGSIREKGLKYLFLKSPVMKKLRRGEIEICGKCIHYNKCGGDRNISYSNHGDFFQVDPECWFMNKTI